MISKREIEDCIKNEIINKHLHGLAGTLQQYVSCEECPRCKPPRDEDELNRCDEWDDNDIIEAVKALKEEK